MDRMAKIIAAGEACMDVAAAAERAKVLAFIKDRENLSRAKHVRGDQVLMELAEALQALAHHEGEA